MGVAVTDIAMQSELASGLRREAGRIGTPVYVYDAEQLRADADAIRQAFPDPAWTRLYSLKANGLPGLVRRVAGLGFGANAVSTGEVTLAARAGVAAGSTALEGIGKTPRDLRTAVELAAVGRPLLWVSLESADEAESLADLAARVLPSKERLDVLVRVNPAVNPETHAGLAVGMASSKFGVALDEVPRVVRAGGGTKGPLRWRGLHVHVGSQLESVTAWRRAVEATLEAFDAANQPEFDTLDVGGGFPAAPGPMPEPADFAAAAKEALSTLPRSQRPQRLAIEPGRAIVARAGWLVSRVLHVRDRGGAAGNGAIRQIVLDAGMTELVRPALYGAAHPIVALTSMGRALTGDEDLDQAVVDGPICESTDRFGTAVLPTLERGDLVAIGLAGAYASAMFSSYNGRPRPPEVLIDDGRRTVLRRRGSLLSLP